MGHKLWLGIKKYRFAICVLAAGISFLSLTDNWKVYTDPIWKAASQFGRFTDGREQTPKEEPSGEIPVKPEDSVQEEIPQAVEETKPEPEQDEEPVAEPEEEARQPETGQEPPAEIWKSVGEEYFEDALFIGDSRTVGMKDYGNFGENTVFYASKGLTIFKLFTEEIVEQEGQRKKISVEEALGQRQFGKIYLMVGINELGTGDAERFGKAYAEAVEHIRELQPDAIIYIQSIIKVTKNRSERGDYITNEGIEERNEAIRGLADEEKIFYLDVNEVVCDESGGMNPEYTTDGVHLMAKCIPIWKEFLQCHAIE